MDDTPPKSSESKLEGWAIVEVMGHSRFAGRISEHKLDIAAMIRIDVPEAGEQPAFSKFFTPQALFSITPCDELTARAAAQEFRSVPVYLYSIVRNPPALENKDPNDEDDDSGQPW